MEGSCAKVRESGTARPVKEIKRLEVGRGRSYSGRVRIWQLQACNHKRVGRRDLELSLLSLCDSFIVQSGQLFDEQTMSLRRLWRWKIIERYADLIEERGGPLKKLSTACPSFELPVASLMLSSSEMTACPMWLMLVERRETGQKQASKQKGQYPSIKPYIRVGKGLVAWLKCVTLLRQL